MKHHRDLRVGLVMKCALCQHENEVGAKFCEECAAPLVRTCANCGHPLSPTAKFCPECAQPAQWALEVAKPHGLNSPESYTPKHLAEKILSSRSAFEGARKQVTVLFVDVSGFTALSERLDPEEVHGLMNRAFELMLAEVHRYEGTVNQFLGDGIMALFGAPIAHEDHARSAVHAALGIRKALQEYQDELRIQRQIAFQVRQGLNTGMVVVGSIGNDLRMDYTAVGDTTNVAARLQNEASQGRIFISEATQRLIEGYFYTRSLGEIAVKGKSEPVRAWEVISARIARGRLDVEAERGLTPLVGRDTELQLLFQCFERTKAGHGQVVFVAGEPGIGKSRLLLEFRNRLGDEATWVEGRSISFGHSMAFYPLVDLLRRNFRIEEGDAEAVIGEKVEQAVLRLGEDLRPILPYLRYLLSIDPGDPAVLTMDPEQRRGEIFDGLRRLTLRASDVRPQVQVFEDVQWMDQATEEYLSFSAESIPTSRVMRILTYRASYVHPFGDLSYHTRISLATLSTEHSLKMAQAMLATETLPKDLKGLIFRKAEGNPFFIEEIVKSLKEVGALRRHDGKYVMDARLDEVSVPNTIQDVIMARIDRLEEEPKRTLQLTSAIGTNFTRRLLDRLTENKDRTEQILQKLKAMEFIYENSVVPEQTYVFRHALTREVAYSSLLVKRRKELHRRIGLAIEELYARRLSEHYEVLAYHFSKGDEWRKALEYLLKAADKAAQALATREALALYDEALEATRGLGVGVGADILMAIHQAKSDIHYIRSDFERSRAEGERLLTLSRQAGDRQMEATALVGMCHASLRAHDIDQALGCAGQVIEAGENIDAMLIQASGHFITSVAYAVTGRLDQAREESDRALARSRSAGKVADKRLPIYFPGMLKSWQGEYSEAARFLAEVRRTALENNLLFPLLFTSFIYGITLTGKGSYDEALATLQEGLTLSEKVGSEIMHHRILNSLGWLHIELMDLDRALDLNQKGADGARKRGDAETIANAELNLGDIFLAKGDLALAQEYFEGVDRLVKNPATSDWMKWRYSMHLLASLGELWVSRSDPVKAQEYVEQCFDLAQRTDSRKYLVKAYRLKGEIAFIRHQLGEAESMLRQGLSIAQAVGNPTQLWKTHYALGQHYMETKKVEEARRHYRAARDVIDMVKANLHNSELRARFESSPLIRPIYEA